MSQASQEIARQFANASVNKKNWGAIAYNVLSEGLSGDGVTDDTAKLQALINKAIAEGRKTLLFPHGSYYVTSLTNADKVDFVGDNSKFVGGYSGTIGDLGGFAAFNADIATNAKTTFGVKGNNTNDDTTNLTNAFKSNYTTILLPDGVYKITDAMLIDSGANKRIVGSKNTVLSVNLTSFKTLLDMRINLSFENIIFDFNNSYVKNGLMYAEDLGVITLKSCKIINAKDMDSTYGSILVYIPNKGNVVDIDNIEFMNIRKKGNGSVLDAEGSLNCLILTDKVTPAPPNGFIKNVKFIDVHNIDVSNAIIYEDTAGIYAISGYNGADGHLSIENVSGYNFGKRLLKIHTSNVTVNNIDGYSDTHDTLSLLTLLDAQGMGSKRNIKVSNVTAKGVMNVGLAAYCSDVTFSNVTIDIQKPVMAGNGANAFGFLLEGNEIILNNINVTAERTIIFTKTTGGVWKNVTIKDATLTIPTWGTYPVQINTGALGFENLTLENVKAFSSATGTGTINSFFEASTLDGTTNKTGKNLTIKNCSIVSVATTSYAIFAKNINGITIDNFTFENDGITKSTRGLQIEASQNIRITNLFIRALVATALDIRSSSVIRISGLVSPNCDFSFFSTNSTDSKVRDLNIAKISLGDETTKNNTYVESNTSSGLTANRPTGVVVGHQHYDTTLLKPIWWNGTAWKDATGTTV